MADKILVAGVWVSKDKKSLMAGHLPYSKFDNQTWKMVTDLLEELAKQIKGAIEENKRI